jgi:hypothetical protein
MDFDRIETHPIFLKTLTDFDGNWLTNRNIFSKSRSNSAILFVYEFTAER